MKIDMRLAAITLRLRQVVTPDLLSAGTIQHRLEDSSEVRRQRDGPANIACIRPLTSALAILGLPRLWPAAPRTTRSLAARYQHPG
jgi:hypothetical protein